MVVNGRVYDKLKFVALVLLPGVSAAYFSLAQVWDFPNAEKVVGTIAVVDTLLGLFLKNSTSLYNASGGGTDGDLIVNEVDGEKYTALAGNGTLDELSAKNTVTLRVVNQKSVPLE